jgi:uncharacterized protein YbgA (DUF1722 family)/uncharacterized protein YbbK (DUF523 family)
MKIKIGISHCLLGEPVRFDGGHKKHHYITGLLKGYFEFVPVCPEVESGMSVPRPTIHLRGNPNAPRLVEVLKPEIDHTDRLHNFSKENVKLYGRLSGFILKSKSPTCGFERVKVYQEKPAQPKLGQGIFARYLSEAYPLLPIEEEGRLNDFRLRENFIERVFSYHRFQTLMKEGGSAQAIIQFHTEHKLTLLAHSEKIYRELGKKLSNVKGVDLKKFAEEYITLFMTGMKKLTNIKTHANVLMHIQGYFKPHLDKADKAELSEAINNYRLGLVPLIVPIVLLKHYLRRFPDDYLLKQYYLFPYPEELMLRNHI